MWTCDGLMVTALASGLNGPGSSPGLGQCVVFLGKTLYSHSLSLHTSVQMGISKSTSRSGTSWFNAGSNLATTLHPTQRERGGGRIVPSHYQDKLPPDGSLVRIQAWPFSPLPTYRSLHCSSSHVTSSTLRQRNLIRVQFKLQSHAHVWTARVKW